MRLLDRLSGLLDGEQGRQDRMESLRLVNTFLAIMGERGYPGMTPFRVQRQRYRQGPRHGAGPGTASAYARTLVLDGIETVGSVSGYLFRAPAGSGGRSILLLQDSTVIPLPAALRFGPAATPLDDDEVRRRCGAGSAISIHGPGLAEQMERVLQTTW